MMLQYSIFTNRIQENRQYDDQNRNKDLHYAEYWFFVNSLPNEYSLQDVETLYILVLSKSEEITKFGMKDNS